MILADSQEEVEEMIKKDSFVSEEFYRDYDIDMLLEANLENHFLLKD
ncbi:MAG: hypothetical protein U0L85_07240 [Bacilli bacterium]|nr:hypothetical protein [Bacilli bacterium]